MDSPCVSKPDKHETKGKKPPRAVASYRGVKRNARSRDERKTVIISRSGKMSKQGTPLFGDGSLDYTFSGEIGLNRSQHWKPADNYFDARDLSQSNRPVV